MVSDSNAVDTDYRRYSVRKVFRVRDALIGFAGHMSEYEKFIAWYRAGGEGGKLRFKTSLSSALILRPDGLYIFDDNATSVQRVRTGREAIGSGAQGALAAFEALGWANPRRAVRIACHVDSQSSGTIRCYSLKKAAA